MSGDGETDVFIKQAKDCIEKLKSHYTEMNPHLEILTSDMTETQKSNFKNKLSQNFLDYQTKVHEFLELNNMRILSQPEKDAQKKIMNILQQLGKLKNNIGQQF